MSVPRVVRDEEALSHALATHIRESSFKPYKPSEVIPLTVGDIVRIYRPMAKSAGLQLFNIKDCREIMDSFWYHLARVVIDKNVIVSVPKLGRFYAYKQRNAEFVNGTWNIDFRTVGGKLYGKSDIAKAGGYYPVIAWRPTQNSRYMYYRNTFFFKIGHSVRHYLYKQFFGNKVDFYEGKASDKEFIETYSNKQSDFEKIRMAMTNLDLNLKHDSH